MKDIDKLKDYRLKYKRYYNIEFDSDYDIHHIDFNRNNNDITNLLLLPKELHSKYHFLTNALGQADKNGDLKLNILLSFLNSDYSAKIMEQLGKTLQEINRWLVYKQELEIKKTRFKYGEI